MNKEKTPELHQLVAFSLLFTIIKLTWKTKKKALRLTITCCCSRITNNPGLSHEVASASQSHCKVFLGANCYLEVEGIRRISLVWQQYISHQEVSTTLQVVPRIFIPLCPADHISCRELRSNFHDCLHCWLTAQLLWRSLLGSAGRETQPWGGIWPLLSGSVDVAGLSHSALVARAGTQAQRPKAAWT